MTTKSYAQFIAAVRALVEQRSRKGERTRAEAHAQLVKEGIITGDGKLTPEYGGDAPNPKTV